MGIFKDKHGDLKLGWTLSLVIVLLIVLSYVLVILTFNYMVAPQQRKICQNYGIVTGREVSFQRPSYDSTVCYVKTDNGWFDLEQINQNTVSES